jgi:hypothetical protein
LAFKVHRFVSGQHHVDLPTAALRTHQPLAPIEHGRFGAVPGGHLDGVGLDLVPAFLAPYNQPHAGRCRGAERHRRTAIGFHLELVSVDLKSAPAASDRFGYPL